MDRTLKAGGRRSVVLESGPEPRVVKRFHGRGLLGRCLDRRRAAREHATLRALLRRGLPVPEVLALERTGGRWQVATRWLEGALPLAELLRSGPPWPAPPPVLARRLGQLLGEGHAAGVRQRDLHGGNVLIDPAGQPWVVDLARVRLGPVGTRAARQDLVRACAFLRERTTPGFRARALVAWRRAAPRRLAALAVGGRAALQLEGAARRERARALDANRGRWTRASGVLAPGQDGDPWLVRRGRGDCGPGQPVFQGCSAGRRRRAFARLGALFEHGLPVLAPARLAPREGWRAEVDGGEECTPLALRLASLAPRARRRLARELGRVCGALRERGYDPQALVPGDLLAGPGGELRLAPEYRPRRATSGGPRRSAPLCAALSGPDGPSARERALFARGFQSALFGAAPERRAWMRELLER